MAITGLLLVGVGYAAPAIARWLLALPSQEMTWLRTACLALTVAFAVIVAVRRERDTYDDV